MTERRVGERIGGYVLEDVIGQGGMGVVYRARHEESGDVVAVKLMAPDLASSPAYRDRFIREAQLSQQIAHPSIVPILGAGDDEGELFIVMELIDGPNLKEIIATDGPLELKRAVRLFGDIAAALDAAHEAGVVHRDVKPQNILIERDPATGKERVFVTDFGLIRPTGQESTVSRTGTVFGSIQYMSPEQVEGLPADGRADVYSLGCVFYECLTGSIPFDGPNEVAVLWAHVNEAPPRLTDQRRDVPGGLDEFVSRALAKHPDDRFLTCGEFIAALEQSVTRRKRPSILPAIRPLVPRKKRDLTEREVWSPNFFPELSRVRAATDRTDWVRVAAVGALLMVSAAAFVHLTVKGGIPAVASSAVDAVGDAATAVSGLGRGVVDAITEDRGPTEPPGTAPDRESQAVASAEGSGSGSPEDAFAPSADPSHVPVGDSAPAEGTAPIPPLTPKIVWAAAPYPNMFDADLWVMEPDGTNKTQLTATSDQESWPSWSPDGSRVAYIRNGDLWLMNADGSNQHKIRECGGADEPWTLSNAGNTGNEEWCLDPDWSPAGNRIAFAEDGRVWTISPSGRKRERVPGLSSRLSWAFGEVDGPSWSPDGKWIAGRCEQQSLCVVRSHDGKKIVIHDGTCVGCGPDSPDGTPDNVAWSPTGEVIAFEQGGQVYTVRPDGSDLARLTASKPPDNSEPGWSGDGSVIIFSLPFPADLAVINADGTGERRIASSSQYNDVMPDWWGPSR